MPDALTPDQVYLQRHAALIVTNSRLRWVIATLALMILVLSFGAYTLAQRLGSFKPMYIRINDVGHAEAISYQAASEYKVQEAEIKYFLMDFVQKYYGRMRGSARDDLARSLYFMTPKLAQQRMADVKANRWLDDFLLGTTDQIEVAVDQISIEDLRQQPYKSTITYAKNYYSQLDHALKGRYKFTAHIQFIVLDKVPMSLIPYNPLGMTVTYLREDQAFTDSSAATAANLDGIQSR